VSAGSTKRFQFELMPQRGSFVSAAEHAVNVEGLGKDYDSSGWTRPSVERARKVSQLQFINCKPLLISVACQVTYV